MKKTPVFLILMLLVFVTVCGFGMCAYRRDKAKYSGLEAACNGQAVAGTTPYVPGTLAHLLAFTHNSTGGWTWGFTLTPSSMLADSRRDASLVICAEQPQTLTLGSCQVTTTGGRTVGVRVFGVRVATIGSNGGTATFAQTQQQLPVRVVETATGVVRASGVVLGPAPRGCDSVVTGNPSASDFRGAPVERDEIASWLRANQLTP